MIKRLPNGFTEERVIIESMLSIADKEGNDVDFKLNAAQADLDTTLSGRDIVPKARQEGVSSYFLARYTAACLSRRNVRAVVISHESDATRRMLQKVHYFIQHIKGPPAQTKTFSKNEVSFPYTNSQFYIGTAGAKRFGRGDTITHLHCSEAAYWQDPQTLTKGLFQAVPRDGEIAIESTGNGVGNWYHKRCMRAYQGKSRFKLHFLPWHTFPEYTLDLTIEEAAVILNNLDGDLEEPRLIEEFNLTPGQLAWRREKLEELDYDMTAFKQEYPITLDECFQATGRSIFPSVRLVNTKTWERVDSDFYKLSNHPIPKHNYIIGVDTSGGTGNDNSVIEVYDIDLREQVAEWASNISPPDRFGEKVLDVANIFSRSMIAVEANNHGIVVLLYLSKTESIDNSRIITMFASDNVNEEKLTGIGIFTNRKSKPVIISSLRQEISQGLIVHSPALKSELETFIENPNNGSFEADNDCLDDRVMASGMCTIAMPRATLELTDPPTLADYEPDPFSIDGMLKDILGGFTKAAYVDITKGSLDEDIIHFP